MPSNSIIFTELLNEKVGGGDDVILNLFPAADAAVTSTPLGEHEKV